MTTDQTIDGVPRELRALLERVVGKASQTPHWDALDEDRISATAELRALLDVGSTTCVIETGHKCDEYVPYRYGVEVKCGTSVDGDVRYCARCKADQPSPVADEYKLHMGDALKVFEALKVDRISRKVEQEDLGPMGATEVETWSTAIGVTLEMQTAMGGCTLIVRTPMAPIVLPDLASAQDFGCESMADGWNACLDEVTRLNNQ